MNISHIRFIFVKVEPQTFEYTLSADTLLYRFIYRSIAFDKYLQTDIK